MVPDWYTVLLFLAIMWTFNDCHLRLVMFLGCAIHANISSSQYQINKLDIGKILPSWWLQYGIIIMGIKHQLTLFPLSPHLIINRLMIRHWYQTYNCNIECEIPNQMAFWKHSEICTWLYIYGMASKQSRMCVHVWRPWKIHTNCLQQACSCQSEKHANCLLEPCSCYTEEHAKCLLQRCSCYTEEHANWLLEPCKCYNEEHANCLLLPHSRYTEEHVNCLLQRCSCYTEEHANWLLQLCKCYNEEHANCFLLLHSCYSKEHANCLLQPCSCYTTEHANCLLQRCSCYNEEHANC